MNRKRGRSKGRRGKSKRGEQDLSEKDLLLNIEKVYKNLNETQKRLFWGLIDEIIGE